MIHIKASRVSAEGTDTGAEYEQAYLQPNDELNGEGWMLYELAWRAFDETSRSTVTWKVRRKRPMILRLTSFFSATLQISFLPLAATYRYLVQTPMHLHVHGATTANEWHMIH